MLSSIRVFSRCGVRSQMCVRNSSSFEVVQETFPPKGNSKCRDEEQEVIKLGASSEVNYSKCEDEECRPSPSQCRQEISKWKQMEAKLKQREDYWREEEDYWIKREDYWKVGVPQTVDAYISSEAKLGQK